MLVKMLQTPGTFAHVLPGVELHAACVLEQVPTEEQSAAPVHFTAGLLRHVPSTVGQVATLAQAALGGLLQAPWVRQSGLATVQALPFFAPAAVQWPGVEGHCALNVQAAAGRQELPGQPPLLAHAFPAFTPPAHTRVPHVPPVSGHWAAL